MPTDVPDQSSVNLSRGLGETISGSGSERLLSNQDDEGLKQSVKTEPVYSDVESSTSNNGVYTITQPICRIYYESKELYGFYKECKYIRHDQVRN